HHAAKQFKHIFADAHLYIPLQPFHQHQSLLPKLTHLSKTLHIPLLPTPHLHYINLQDKTPYTSLKAIKEANQLPDLDEHPAENH
ncbi:hypothetical protein, partial [Bacillus pumilus]|uniref:hypothetical protein n=1 Tax=Bacillus pumilus TaxID=1408 RepID=UPI001C92E976